jgi:hypothetical protein
MKSQNELILDHFLSGKTLTPMKALHVYGCTRLAARVYELKRRGHDIQAEYKVDEMGRGYAEYRLALRDRFGRRKAA